MIGARALLAFGGVGAVVLLAVAIFAGPTGAQRTTVAASSAEARNALDAAIAARRAAESRRQVLERRAEEARDAAERAARDAAVLAARVQVAEAEIAAAEARLSLANRERAILREALGRRQQPAVRLVAALQKFARRPGGLAVLRPGSVRDVVYLWAIMEGSMPQLQARTAGLRAQLADSRRLGQDAGAAAVALRAEQVALDIRQTELAAQEQRQRLVMQEAHGTASREAERALALGEEARDLNHLLAEMDRAVRLRERLARLSGPVPRPVQPEQALAVPDAPPVTAVNTGAAPPAPYLLPVTGRTIAGFGARTEGGLSSGVTFAPRPSAQVIAPAAGRIIFAGPYRGYGQIVILEHSGGWISLVTGLTRVGVTVGQTIVTGAPIGVAAATDPSITLELRHEGQAVNPLQFVG